MTKDEAQKTLEDFMRDIEPIIKRSNFHAFALSAMLIYNEEQHLSRYTTLLQGHTPCVVHSLARSLVTELSDEDMVNFTKHLFMALQEKHGTRTDDILRSMNVPLDKDGKPILN